MRPVVSLFPLKGEIGDTLHVLDEWQRWQVAQGLSQRTIKERRIVILHLSELSKTAALEVTPDNIIDYLGRAHLSQSSKASYHATIRAFYKWAVLTGRIDTDPSASTPRPRRPKGAPRPVRTAHVSALLAVANRRRTRAMIILAAYAGLRVHEVAKFRGEDLDTIGEIITVTGKGGKTAMIPAHPAILELARTMPRRGYWFPAYGKQTNAPCITSTQVSRVIGNAMRRAGFDGKAHQLRHWYASTLLDEGVDVRVVKEMMRHESLASTEIYTRVSMKKMFDGIEHLPMAA
ncbi:MAG: hypothetical protein D3X82_13735 [Candidatus Leucobacter sulfamidivorax]|nr:hypothetical protein [Candidatus Leucobacter sulfamidivorax]